MKKIIIAILVSILLIGCASSSKAGESHRVLEEVYGDGWSSVGIIRDNETGIEYIYIKNGKYGVAITPRLTGDKKND